MELDKYIRRCYEILPPLSDHEFPWIVTENADEIVKEIVFGLRHGEYRTDGGAAIHETAKIEAGVVLKDNIVVGKDCFVGAGAYLRGGVYLSENVVVGPGCEIKSSFIFDKSRIAHFNYIGDSIIGEDVNFEAGSVIANCFNEREWANKNIRVIIGGKEFDTGIEKFGSIVGDHSRIGANAVLNPGSTLLPGTIVGRLECYDQFRK